MVVDEKGNVADRGWILVRHFFVPDCTMVVEPEPASLMMQSMGDVGAVRLKVSMGDLWLLKP